VRAAHWQMPCGNTEDSSLLNTIFDGKVHLLVKHDVIIKRQQPPHVKDVAADCSRLVTGASDRVSADLAPASRRPCDAEAQLW
jgi:hypothetical protein